MNADQLRAMQAPLKTAYKENPASALITLKARGRVEQKSLTFVLETGKPGAPVGLHPAAGGDGTTACSAEILLEALAGCAGVSLAAVSTAMGITLRAATLTVEGDLDFRGTLGVSRDVPVGFTAIRMTFDVDADVPQEKIARLVELTERYCVVFRTLTTPPSIEIKVGSPPVGDFQGSTV